MIDQPSWPIQEYLDLRDRLRDLPPEQQEVEIAGVFRNASARSGAAHVSRHANFPSAPAHTNNALSLRDVEGRERARMTVAQDGTPALEFLDSAGNVTHRYPQ